MLRRRAMGGRLPDGFQEVEHLEAHIVGPTSGQAISTNFRILNSSRYVIKFKQTFVRAYTFGFGGADGNTAVGLYFGDNGKTPLFTMSHAGSVSSVYATNIQIAEFDVQNARITLNGSVIFEGEITQTLTGQYPLTLFKMNKSNNAYYGGIAIYYCHCFDNNILVHEFIPAYRVSDNEPGMFDICTQLFHTNTGNTQGFTVGPDVL